jgi:hypothetical protein
LCCRKVGFVLCSLELPKVVNGDHCRDRRFPER